MDVEYRKKRVEEIDVLRGIGIVLMIMGHVGYGTMFHRFIHSFHMPLFYFISGYFFNPDSNVCNFIIKKTKTLLLPYAVFAVLHLGIWILLNPAKQSLIFEMICNIIFFPNADIYPIAGGLWFLVSLYITELIVFLAVRKNDNYFFWDIFFILLVLFASICTRVIPFELPFTIDSSLVGAGILYTAFRLKNYWNVAQHYVRTISNWKVYVLTAIVTISILCHETINIRVCWLGRVPIFWWINAIGSIFLLWYYSSKLVQHKCLQGLSIILKRIGQDSIVYLCLNQLIILVIAYCVPIAHPNIITVLTVAVLSLCSYILHHSKLRFIIGK